VINKTLYACESCGSCPANQTRVECGGTNPGRCVNNCVYTWSTGVCSKTCGGYQIVSPAVTQYADSSNPVQCPTPYAQSCSNNCYLYLYSGQDFNGNYRGTLGPIYNSEYRLFSPATTITRDNDLRSMKVPGGLTLELYTEPNYTGLMGTYNGYWEGRVQFDVASSMRWYFTDPRVPTIVSPSSITCPNGGTLNADRHYCDKGSTHQYVVFGCVYWCQDSAYWANGWSQCKPGQNCTGKFYGCTDNKSCRANSIINCPPGYTADWTNLACIRF
jgi:hypothetical protein